MKNKRGILLMTGGLLLIAAALCLTVGNVTEGRRAGSSAEKALREVSARVPETGSPAQEPAVPDYVLNPEMEMPTVEAEGKDYIGVLEIPALDLSLPVMSGWSYPNLKLAPCRFSGSAYLGDLIIAGHNYRQHFGGLKNLTVGDAVRFTDAAGNLFSYTVVQIEQLPGDALEDLEAGEWDLTLFTCTIEGRGRVTVRCMLCPS